jgi:lipopolysaccharide biosynthesis glycosyltransferase
MNEARHVCLCGDDGYAVPLAATLKSIERSQPDPTHLAVTVLGFGLTSRSTDRLRRSVPQLDLRFRDVESQLPSDLPENAQLTRAAYGRLAAPALVEAERFVYLDADLIVNDDLSYLFEFDLAGNPIAAARSVNIPTVSSPLGLMDWKRLGLAPNTPYFNSGVLVVDRAAWQSADLTHRVLDFVRDYRDHARFLDQDGMNAVLAGKFARLPLRWNQEYMLRTGRHLGYLVFPQAEVTEAERAPAIVHFTAREKPWLKWCRDPATGDWWELIRSTEFRGYEPPSPPVRERAAALISRLLGYDVGPKRPGRT